MKKTLITSLFTTLALAAGAQTIPRMAGPEH